MNAAPMSFPAGKIRVLIATTNGPVEVLLLTEEDPVIGRSVACIGGTTETADIAAAYHAFVARPTGVIEARYGHSCYRLDVSGRIDAGSSWQLGVLAAHALHAAGRLAQENETADGVLWATGSVRAVDLTVGAVSHVPEKIENSLERLKQERAAGRPVMLAVPAANASEVPATRARELSDLGVEILSVPRVEALFDALAMTLPGGGAKGAAPAAAAIEASPRAPAAPSRWYVWASAAALIAIVIAAGVLARVWDFPRSSSTSAGPAAATTSESPGAAAAPAPPQPTLTAQQSTKLDPELVPFVSARERKRIRDEYMTAPDYKALAKSMVRMAFVVGEASQEAADRAAMKACAEAHAAAPRGATAVQQAERTCELYASGSAVVTHRNAPPMPPKPWTNAAVERPFVSGEFPMIRAKLKDASEYSGYPRSKAIVLSASGSWYVTFAQESAEEAMRRSLERCGYLEQAACLLIAVDDTFVAAVPTSARAVGFYRPDALFAARPDERAEMARRLAGATDGWNAVALGAKGHLGIITGARSESAAVSGALDACAAHDQSCRIAVIGPFLVEPDPAKPAPPAPAPPTAAAVPPAPKPTPAAPESKPLDPDHIPFVLSRYRKRVRDEYMNAPSYKAVAMSLSAVGLATGKPDQETANRAAMADCERLTGAMPKNPSPADQADRTCELYASGMVLVTHRGAPMPPKPWINASVERPFVTSEFPMIQQKLGNGFQYPPFPRSKALAMAPSGQWYVVHSQESVEEAIRRALERCGYLEQVACLVIAVDDRFVTAVPTMGRPTGLYRAEAFFGGRSDERAEMARRLASATEGWSAVALGARGHLGIATGARSEGAAVGGALDDCNAHDQNCHIVVIGPFLVEPDPGNADPSSLQ